MYNNCWIHITLPLKPGPSPSEFRWTKAPPKPKAKPKAKQSPLEIEPAPAESTEVAKVEILKWLWFVYNFGSMMRQASMKYATWFRPHGFETNDQLVGKPLPSVD